MVFFGLTTDYVVVTTTFEELLRTAWGSVMDTVVGAVVTLVVSVVFPRISVDLETVVYSTIFEVMTGVTIDGEMTSVVTIFPTFGLKLS